MSTWILEAEIAVVLAVASLPIAVFPLVYRHYRRYGRFAGWPAVLTLATFVYVCGLAAFTLFPLPEANDSFCTLREEISYWQLTPFASVADILDQARAVGLVSTLTSGVFLQVAFNVLLLLPLGFLLGYRYRRSFGQAVALGLATSLLIELTQGTGVWGLYGCPYRLADVDDLLTNTAGAAVGWLIAAALVRILPDPDPPPTSDDAPPRVRRRLAATFLDYVAVVLFGFALQIPFVLVASALGGDDPEDLSWFEPGATILGTVVPIVVLMAMLPMLRDDRSGPGQITTWLAVRSHRQPATLRAVVTRFCVRWLPVVLLSFWQPLAAILVVAVIEITTVAVRSDRRSASGSVARTDTVTRRSVSA